MAEFLTLSLLCVPVISLRIDLQVGINQFISFSLIEPGEVCRNFVSNFENDDECHKSKPVPMNNKVGPCNNS